MVRARLIVDRLIEHGRIDDQGRDLLVVGAGPTGLTAPIQTADSRVRTIVVDKKKEHAFLLGECTSRDVEPTLYDWPALHWAAGRFPWAREEMPRSWRRGKASAIANGWDKRLNDWKLQLGADLEIRYETTIALGFGGAPPATIEDDFVEVSFVSSTTYAPQRFGAVLSCVGWGDQRCELPPYRGFAFWERDEFEHPFCSRSSQPRVLISGGGDGALQDLIRILTRGSAARAFGLFLDAMRGYGGVLSAVTEEVMAAEDIARRAWSWNENEDQDDIVLSELEAAHLRAIGYLRSSTAWPTVEAAVRKMLVEPAPSVFILHSRAYFTHCYALNRFLALLLLSVVPSEMRKPNSRVLRVEGAAGHACAGDPEGCHGQPHHVDFMEGSTADRQDFDVVILRHGLKGPKRIFTGVEPARVRQILPYFLYD